MKITPDQLEELGIDGVQRGDEYLAPCPAHKDRTGKVDSDPSWSVNLEKGVFHCFSCGWSGTVATLVSYLGGDVAAIGAGSVDVAPSKKVADIMGILQDVEQNRYLRPPLKVSFESALDVFEDPPQWAMDSRLLTAEACIEMEVRWDPRIEAWIFPIRDSHHDLLGWQIKGARTKVFRNFPAGIRKSGSLYGYSVAINSEFVVVVESPLDAVRLVALDIPAVATYGASVSSTQLQLLSVRSFPSVIAAFDNDEAGKRATQKLIESPFPTNLHVMQYPEGSVSGDDPGVLSDAQLSHAVKTAPHVLDLETA